MQPDSITLPVDTLNNGTTQNETYTRFEEFQNRATYIGSSHSPDHRDTLSLYRSFPTKTGNFKGVSKTSVKFSKDYTIVGVDSSTTLTAPIIIEISVAAPVGITTDALKTARQRAIALLDLDSVMEPLNSQLMV